MGQGAKKATQNLGQKPSEGISWNSCLGFLGVAPLIIIIPLSIIRGTLGHVPRLNVTSHRIDCVDLFGLGNQKMDL